MSLNKVILLGGNHHNGLGLVRGFGRQGILSFGIIIGKGSKNSFIKKSKYWDRTWSVENEEEALEILLSEFQGEMLKPVVIPWSDGAAEMLDLNYDRLRDKYILPTLGCKQGAIVTLMDKDRQVAFAKELGFEMLPSQTVAIKGRVENDLPYPVILKPVTSIEGGKSDMSVCLDSNEFASSIEDLKQKGFSRVLIQRYLKEREEYVVTGAITDNRYSFSVIKHIRQWPLHFGTGSFSETVVNDEINSYCSMLCEQLRKKGYRGPIDFELFKSEKGELFLNEINWRSSGRNFISKHTDIESAYMYYCDETNKPYAVETFNKKHIYSMNETTDIKHVISKNISLRQWLSSVRKTKSFSVWDLTDIKPAIARYAGMVLKVGRGGH